MLKTLYIRDAFKCGEDSEVELIGWVRSKRRHGKLVFLDLRDSTGIIQIAVKQGIADSETFMKALDVGLESAVKVRGKIKRDARAPGGVELHCNHIEVFGPSLDGFPIRKGVGLKFLLDNRHLHLRSPKVAMIMKIRANLMDIARRWLRENGFIEVNCPTFITAAVEGGATLFKLDYFGRTAYLTQSVQFYQEAAIYSLEKVYSLQPSFRAELSRTRRHLTEFWHLEVEMAYADLYDIMKVIEELVYAIVSNLSKESEVELKALDKVVKPEMAEPPYPRIKYAEALQILQSKNVNINWGDDFGADEERILSKEFEKPFFVTHYPKEAKAFYHMPDPNDPSVCLNTDLLAPGGYGEIVGGGQRIHDYNLLLERIRENGLNVEDYRWYIDLRKYGSVPHSGFGLGIERMLWWLLQLPHIRSACLFPRTPTRVYP
ncbi:MAG: asparagine--tRNA ligase [Thaumarchaeota archaeon]|nr:asparagine--tRNA ligase [Candidatus Geocrenenecus arthurdayi]MCL7390432.1 asparagine--tRNA ligase [Candidatus Geocrenenecus arthurdayi]MCL7396085.1 asparagine--tRNA ligase [Candidatus Geocrenenecus arthurdayi]MCL7401482.1 asparagine--tRNA ligase [Candidatus Geocrenenecus arthurdayi]MCL7402783.1 asparagine--tRNA ligase [Candidatus Geocrenenecus arthurdayi]